jgi:hypothetical protein
MIDRGQSLSEIQRGGLTLEYESRWGRDPDWTGEDFVAAVYESLVNDPREPLLSSSR